MVHFAEINQALSPYSMLQHIGRVATPKLVPRNYLRYMQTTLKMRGGGLVSEFMWGIVDTVFVIRFKNNEKYSLYFYQHISFFTYIFSFWGMYLVWQVTYIHLRNLFCPNIPQNIWEKLNIHYPSTETV